MSHPSTDAEIIKAANKLISWAMYLPVSLPERNLAIVAAQDLIAAIKGFEKRRAA